MRTLCRSKISVLAFLLGFGQAWADDVQWAHVTEVQNNQVVINTEKMDIKKDEKYVLQGGKGGKEIVGIIQIVEVNQTVAKGKLLSGKALTGDILAQNLLKPVPKGPPPSWGLQFQVISNTMTAKETDLLASQVDDVKMNGIASGIYGYYNHPLNSWLVLHGGLGYEPFKAFGDSQIAGCNQFSSTHCTVDLQYISAHGAARFVLEKDNRKYWTELGVSVKHSLATSSTALEESKISQISTLDAGLGIDIPWGAQNYIPVSVQYSIFPTSEDVSASSWLLRCGYGWIF